MGLFNANEWSWWLALSIGDYNDGLVYWDYNEETTESDISVLKRYYTMSHFSRYLSAGDIRIGLADSDKLNISGIDSIAFKKENGDIVIIMINNTNLTRNITIRGDYTSMTTVTTSTSKNLEEISSEYNNKIELEEKSITTIILAENN